MKETTFVLDDLNIDLAKAPTDVKLTALRDTVKQKLEAAIGNNPVNLDPNDIKKALQKVPDLTQWPVLKNRLYIVA